MTIDMISQVLHTGYVDANGWMADLERLGLREEQTGRVRNRVFRDTPYVALFADS